MQVLAGITPRLLKEGSVRRAIHDENQTLGGHPVQQLADLERAAHVTAREVTQVHQYDVGARDQPSQYRLPRIRVAGGNR